jgi:CO dehydrogenase/acetyl-CoA synthase gamma subunit (corrinoid Fe-S protein)
MKLHQKAYLLVELSKADSSWDYDLVAKALEEYNVSGSRWVNTFRVALDELSAAGLANSTDKKLDDGTHVGADKVLFKYELTEFGRTRMRETGLL